jgi:DHA1 family multidrug resistance protein-like MFS transporter
MSNLIRDAPIGQIIRYLTKNRLLKYPEELDTWQCPHSYNGDAAAEKITATQLDEATREHVAEPLEPIINEKTESKEEIQSPQEDVADFSSSDGEAVEGAAMEKITTHKEDDQSHLENIRTVRTTTGIERVGTRSALTQSKTREQLEEAFRLSMLEVGPSRPVIPATLDDGTILVDWYTTDDQE